MAYNSFAYQINGTVASGVAETITVNTLQDGYLGDVMFKFGSAVSGTLTISVTHNSITYIVGEVTLLNNQTAIYQSEHIILEVGDVITLEQNTGVSGNYSVNMFK